MKSVIELCYGCGGGVQSKRVGRWVDCCPTNNDGH